MPSMKTIKRRIGSVGTTKKIMRAMGMVAAAKLQKDKVRLRAASPFFDEAMKMIDELHSCENAMENQFFRPREVRNTAYIIITSDRGLCGSYNANLIKEALAHMNAGKNEKIVAIGLKGYDYFRRHGKNVLERYDVKTAFYEDAERIAGSVVSLYASGAIDEAYVAYTRFESALRHVPEVAKVLPVGTKAARRAGGMKYEPDVHAFLHHAIPIYFSAFLFAAVNESITCEQAARMISMESAVDNASEIIGKLTRAYNRRRQTAITQEISEIVSSANMLK